MKFVLFVEGPTEKLVLPQFLKRWLDVRLDKRVGIQPVQFEGYAQLICDTPTKARLYLAKEDVIAVIALLDLYGPNIYPEDKPDKVSRYEWAKSHLEGRVGHSRFRQFFAVHELEAWLLSVPSLFPTDIARGFPGRASNPEDVNFNEPPAKLLARLYWEKTRRSYKKIVDGKQLFDKLDPNAAYEKCPMLREMLDEMLRLAVEAGQ